MGVREGQGMAFAAFGNVSNLSRGVRCPAASSESSLPRMDGFPGFCLPDDLLRREVQAKKVDHPPSPFGFGRLCGAAWGLCKRVESGLSSGL